MCDKNLVGAGAKGHSVTFMFGAEACYHFQSPKQEETNLD